MLNNKIKYILAVFIILLLSMNAFSATNITDDSTVASPQSSSSDKVAADDSTDDSQNNGNTDNSGNTNTNENNTGKKTFGNGNFSFGNGTFGSGGNRSTFSFNRSGNNSTGFDISSILDYLTKMLGGDNATNETNSEVSDVPKVVTSVSYAPVSKSSTFGVPSSHAIQRLRDNKTISEGNTLTLDGLNKLFDSNFSNGHLLVYIDGKLVFNEVTTDDLSTPIFQIINKYLGYHKVTVEFTANGNSNTNKYTEDVLII